MKTPRDETIGDAMRRNGISRRTLLKFCSGIAASMALPASMVPAMAQNVLQSRRQSVIWFSCQECTGCIESLTRSYAPTLENMLFNMISLDYQEALMAAAGHAAEAVRRSGRFGARASAPEIAAHLTDAAALQVYLLTARDTPARALLDLLAVMEPAGIATSLVTLRNRAPRPVALATSLPQAEVAP